MYKTELHCHSAEVSNCAHANSDLIAERYIAAGYTTVVITNHFNKNTFKNKRFDMLNEPWDRKVDYFMNGYYELVRAANGRFKVLLGMELRFLGGSENDYLVYGITEEFLRSHPEMLESNIKDFSVILRNAGMLLIQAHPFRNKMITVNPDYLDGIEVFNGHIKHDSRNDIAYRWSEKFNLIKTSGSDFHDESHIIGGGILTSDPITTNDELLSAIRSGNYELIRSDSVPY